MDYPFRRGEMFRCLLSLLVLTASVGAPLRTDTSRRTRHFASHEAPARSAVVRVRTLSPGGFFRGFRAVVGAADGEGFEARADHERPRNLGTHLSAAASAAPLSGDQGRAARLNPRLRC